MIQVVRKWSQRLAAGHLTTVRVCRILGVCSACFPIGVFSRVVVLAFLLCLSFRRGALFLFRWALCTARNLSHFFLIFSSLREPHTFRPIVGTKHRENFVGSFCSEGEIAGP